MSVNRRRMALAGALLALIIAGFAIRRRLPESAEARGRSGSAVPSIAHPGPGATSESSKPEAALPASPKPPNPGSGAIRREFRLRDDAGRPLSAKIKVLISWDHFKTVQIVDVESDGHGNADLSLDPSAWVLLDVRAPGHRGRQRPPFTWGDLPEEPVDFSLEAATPVVLRSLSNSGAPVTNTRLRFSPEFPPGDFAGLAATKMGIVDEELITDAQGRGSLASLRPGPYVVTFPDHPKWPGIRVSAEDLGRPPLTLRLPWATDP